MIPIYLILGVVFTGIGFLVKALPEAISGYSSMSADEKKKVDILGLSSMMKKHFIVIGVALCILPTSLNWIGRSMEADVVMGGVIFTGLLLMFYQTPKYYHNEYSTLQKFFPFILVLFIFVGVVGALVHGSSSPDVSISQGEITITGQYGLKERVREIEWVENIPSIGIKNNGLGFGGIKKGHFEVGEWGDCILFLQNDKGPFIKIITYETPIVMNRNSPEETRSLYQLLRQDLKPERAEKDS